MNPQTIRSPARWNIALADAPPSSDVVVVGAGPAGSACALRLAQAGWRVLLVDRRVLPRDKVCGDALIPDAIGALRQLGLHERVRAAGRPVDSAFCAAPFGQAVSVPGEMIVLPRRELDEILARSAVDQGATLVAPAHFVRPLAGADGRVSGVVLATDGQERTITARWVVLATGAAAAPLEAAGVCQRRAASGFALRQYIRHEALAQDMPGLRFVWHRSLRGGYGWVFPGPKGVCNIGVGISSPARGGGDAREGVRLHQLFECFVALDPLAARLVREGQPMGPVKGAALRFDLDGAQCVRPGLLVAGEAAGSTYRLTGEGIGKAMETGLAAAECLLADQGPAPSPAADERVAQAYAARLDGLRPRFEMYRRAAHFNRYPWLISLVIWKARRLPKAIAAMADILAERRLPDTLLSWRGVKLMLRRR